jgi:small subunit ribosomal protein S13
MARIAGVNVPDKKRIAIALSYIHGIGRPTAFKICEKLGIDLSMRMGEASEDILNRIRSEIEKGGYDRGRPAP